MIDVFGANGFGCLKNVELKLTKLHALVGPNDSGKSTILKGIRTISALVDGRRGAQEIPAALLHTPCLLFASVEGGRVEFTRALGGDDGLRGPDSAKTGVRGAELVRWSTSAMRGSSAVVEDLESFWRYGGQGLPGVLANVFLRDEAALAALNARLRELFPALDSIRVAPANGGFRVEARLRDGRVVEPEQLSDGILYYLAFTVIRHLAEPSIVLIDEPENGLHPARIADIVATLRAVTETQSVQIIMATHSPLILNELRPDEVTVVTRTPERGTIVTPIASTPHFSDRMKAYDLGELWLSYCDGKLEAPLLEGQE